MLARLSALAAALRRPEYTGENRCLPCMVVNAVLAVATAELVRRLVPLDPAGSLAVAGVVLLLAGALIYLRGYLVPGTPELTKTYFPDRLLRYFDHGPTPAAPAGDIDPAELLEGAGVVEECADVDDLCLTEAFREAWHARIDQRRDAATSRDDLAAVLDLPRESLTLEDHGHAFVALADGGQIEGSAAGGLLRVGQWESEGAFIADMAAADALDGRVDGWRELTPVDRGRVLNGLRVFLDACPACGGAVEFGEETVESCCRSREVVAVTCTDCGQRLFEAEQPAAG